MVGDQGGVMAPPIFLNYTFATEAFTVYKVKVGLGEGKST